MEGHWRYTVLIAVLLFAPVLLACNKVRGPGVADVPTEREEREGTDPEAEGTASSVHSTEAPSSSESSETSDTLWRDAGFSSYICEPFQPVGELSLNLDRVFAVGQDAAGTFFVVTRAEDELISDFSLYISKEGVLYRRDQTSGGKGPGEAGSYQYAIELGHPGGQEEEYRFQLLIEVDVETLALRKMALDYPPFDPDRLISNADETLTVVSPDQIASLPAVDENPAWECYCYGRLTDGREVLLLQRYLDYTSISYDHRVFFGPADDMAEGLLTARVYTDMMTDISEATFEVDGAQALFQCSRAQDGRARAFVLNDEEHALVGEEDCNTHEDSLAFRCPEQAE